MKKGNALILLSILVCLPGWAAGKDLSLRQRVTAGGPHARTHEMVQYWTDDKSITDDAHMRTIADLSTKTLTIINKEKKTYSVVPFDELRQRAEELKKQLPPEAQQALSENRMTIEPTGKTTTIAGYQAKEYRIDAGRLQGSVWVTDAVELGPAAQQLKEFAGAIGGTAVFGGALTQAIANLNGLPLRTSLRMEPQKMTMTTEVEAVRQQSPPRQVLAIPSGYAKVPWEPGRRSRSATG